MVGLSTCQGSYDTVASHPALNQNSWHSKLFLLYRLLLTSGFLVPLLLPHILDCYCCSYFCFKHVLLILICFVCSFFKIAFKKIKCKKQQLLLPVPVPLPPFSARCMAYLGIYSRNQFSYAILLLLLHQEM